MCEHPLFVVKDKPSEGSSNKMKPLDGPPSLQFNSFGEGGSFSSEGGDEIKEELLSNAPRVQRRVIRRRESEPSREHRNNSLGMTG